MGLSLGRYHEGPESQGAMTGIVHAVGFDPAVANPSGWMPGIPQSASHDSWDRTEVREVPSRDLDTAPTQLRKGLGLVGDRMKCDSIRDDLVVDGRLLLFGGIVCVRRPPSPPKFRYFEN
jgi:hypothetical protein